MSIYKKVSKGAIFILGSFFALFAVQLGSQASKIVRGEAPTLFKPDVAQADAPSSDGDSYGDGCGGGC